MWGFMKKLTDKDKEEKEKRRKDKLEKDKRKNDNTLTTDELIRLNEAQRSLTRKTVTSNKEEVPAETYPILDLPVITSKSSNPASRLNRQNPPAVQPKPAKKGILKLKPTTTSPNQSFTNAQENSQDGHVNSKKDIKNIISNFDKTLDQKPIQPSYKKSKPVPLSPKNAKPVLLLATNQVDMSSLPVSSKPLILRADSPIHKSFKKVSLKVPTTSAPICLKDRKIVLKRSPNGDLGLSLRKGVTVDHSQKDGWKQVIFAEAKAKVGDLGLRPGDRIVEVNGTGVDSLSREGVVELLKKEASEVHVVVRGVSELMELVGSKSADEVLSGGSSRRLGRATSIKYHNQKAKTEDQLASERALVSTDQVWLVHKEGYSLCCLQGQAVEGRVKVKTEAGEVLEVAEEDIEKASPGKFDHLEDVSGLRYLNECSLLHTLRHRYHSNLCYTYAGFSLLAMNSLLPLSVYSDKVVQHIKTFKQQELPPHIFSAAQSTFKSMMASRKDQALVMLGDAGSGKSFQCQNILHYFLSSSGALNNVLNADKLSAVWTLLESFGGSRSAWSASSSHFTHVFTLDFDQNGQITSASIQAMLLEKRRLVTGGASTFHIFHQFLSGLESGMRKDLHLDYMDTNHPYLTFASVADDKRRCQQQWAKIVTSFQQLSFTPQELKAFCLVLSAIYHLGSARAVKGGNNKATFEHLPSAEHAASLLGCSVEDLQKNIFQSSSSSSSSHHLHLKLPSSKDPLLPLLSPEELLEGFLMGLYGELFNCLVALINRSLSSNLRSSASIMLVDSPGFRASPTSCLDHLFHNYAHERLQQLFHKNTFDNTADLYAQEEVETNLNFPESPSSILIKLIDSPPQNLSRSPGNDKLSSNEGLLWMLDEMSLLPSCTDQAFVQEALLEYSAYKYHKQPLIAAAATANSFQLLHMNGTAAVEYRAEGWLRSCRDASSASKLIVPLLLDSKHTEVSDMFSQTCRSLGTVLGGSLVGMGDLHSTSSLRRVSSMKRSFVSGTAAVKKKSLCLQVKFQMDSLVDMLRRMNVSFVHCLLPFRPSSTTPPANHPIDTPFLRQQLRAYQVLPSARLYKQGYPDHMTYGDFLHKYKIFSQAPHVDNKTAVDSILKDLDIDESSYYLGASKVLLHAGVLVELEGLKEARVSDWLVALQACCRMRLACRKLAKLKIQHVAVMCIQKNVRKLMAVRHWPWWRLYTKVQPLLNVQRTEDELKDREYEVEQLRGKLEKVEKERAEYKGMSERLELQLSELCLEAQEQEATATQAAEMLERETTLRLGLEKQVKELQSRVASLEGQNRAIEVELMDAKVVNASVIESDADEDLADGSLYKERYERLKREGEVRSKRQEAVHEEDLARLEAAKRGLEKKVMEANLEVERLERQLQEGRKRQQRGDDEVADTKIHLEQQVARNAQLEKKQRKFDGEMSKLTEQWRQEKSHRERLQREKDDITGAKYALEQQLKDTQTDLEVESDKSKRLERQIQEALSAEKDDTESWKSRQVRTELEGKVAELEEELDDQAATIQQLQQTKLRLEMSQEKTRQQLSKEVEERESDLDDLKRNYHKKIRDLEAQSEEEYEERQKVLREKKELERKMQALLEERPSRDKDVELLLRRDLKRTKALLQDAQLMVNKYQQTAGNRTTLRQLKDQLEDAEFSAAAALKAKKGMEMEVADLQGQLDGMSRLKHEAEERYIFMNKENLDLKSRVEEMEEDEAEVLKKYKTAVQQHSLDLIKFDDQSRQIESLQQEREQLKEEMGRLRSRTEYFETSTVDKETIGRLEAKIRDQEAKVDFEQTTRRRLETQASRLKEQLDSEFDQRQSKKADEKKTQEELRIIQRKFKELQDEVNELRLKEADSSKKKLEMERKLEDALLELEQSHGDLHLAFKRINELTTVMESDMLNDDDDDDEDDLDIDDDYDDDEAGYDGNMPSLKLKSSLPDEEGAALKGKAQEDSEA